MGLQGFNADSWMNLRLTSQPEVDHTLVAQSASEFASAQGFATTVKSLRRNASSRFIYPCVMRTAAFSISLWHLQDFVYCSSMGYDNGLGEGFCTVCALRLYY